MSDRIIKANFTIELADYKRAVWLHMKPRKIFAFLGVMVVVLAMSALTTCILVVPRSTQSGLVIFLLAAALGYLPFYFFYQIPHQCARIYKQTKLLHEPVMCEITESHFVAKQESGECRIPWETFHRWKGNQDLVLVYPNDAMFHIVPRHGFASAADFEEFQKILKAKLRRAG